MFESDVKVKRLLLFLKILCAVEALQVLLRIDVRDLTDSFIWHEGHLLLGVRLAFIQVILLVRGLRNRLVRVGFKLVLLLRLLFIDVERVLN